MPDSPKIDICIVTYRRPDMLKRLLRSLEHLTFENYPMADVRVVLVNNCPEDSSFAELADAFQSYRWPLVFFVEPERGISQARNTAIRQARPEADFIAILDDDEEATPPWLDELLFVQAHYAADVVSGPVLPVFPSDAPEWAIGGFYDRPRYATGTDLPSFSTCNVLLCKPFLDQFPEPFDLLLSLNGGSDHLLSLRLKRAGAKMVWADRAILREYHPPGRLRVAWVLARAFRFGNTNIFCDRILDGAFSFPMLLRIAKGFFRVIIGIAFIFITLPLLLLGKKTATIRALRFFAYGLGILSGAAGYLYGEYRVTHGR